MKSKLAATIAFGVVVVLARASGAAPNQFTVQGVLRDGSGSLESMMVNITVSFFDAQTAGNAVGATFGPQAVMAEDGLFTIAYSVSDTTPFSAASAVWMEVTAGNDTFPRQLVTSEMFAMVCGVADQAKALASTCSGCVTSAMITSLDGAKLTGSIATATIPAANVTGTVADSSKLGGVVAASYLQTTSTVVVSANSKTYSINAVYCGATGAIADTSTIGGYSGAKALCETACSSASAHMCSAEDISRSASLGITMPDGWYSKMAIGPSNDDCVGWTSNSPSDNGPAWNPKHEGGQPAPLQQHDGVDSLLQLVSQIRRSPDLLRV